MESTNHRKINIIDKIENSNDKYGWVILGLYIVLLSSISFFHEPWFDEAQSWIIARDVSLKDIIFFIPHYEGHPPLWYIYLIPFAKSGLPYEFGLKLAAIIINSISVGLLIFKAPFKKIIRYTIPFTYYFFFLYGVVSRCYNLTMLGFILMAITYKNRNIKPLLYILSMMLVCASTAYGLLFCAGCALIWTIEIIAKENNIKKLLPRLIKDKRFFALILLLIFAILLVFLIIPRKDTYAANSSLYTTSLITRLFYMFILAPIEATFFTAIPGNYFIRDFEIQPYIYIVGSILFLLFALILYFVGKRHKKILILILPYTFFAIFSASVYFTEHHISIITYFLLFWFWICFDSKHKQKLLLPKILSNKMPNEDIIKAKKLLWILPAILVVIPFYWNICACTSEIQVNYCSARDVANFISKNNMEDKLIMTEWVNAKTSNNTTYTDINCQSTPSILAYFNENIFYTLNNGDNNLCYNTHIIPTKSEIANAYETWKNLGAPDVLIGHPHIGLVFELEVTIKDYALVKVINEKRISKNDSTILGGFLRIYIRRDLLDYYGFEEIDEDQWMDILMGKIQID